MAAISSSGPPLHGTTSTSRYVQVVSQIERLRATVLPLIALLRTNRM